MIGLFFPNCSISIPNSNSVTELNIVLRHIHLGIKLSKTKCFKSVPSDSDGQTLSISTFTLVPPLSKVPSAVGNTEIRRDDLRMTGKDSEVRTDVSQSANPGTVTRLSNGFLKSQKIEVWPISLMKWHQMRVRGKFCLNKGLAKRWRAKTAICRLFSGLMADILMTRYNVIYFVWCELQAKKQWNGRLTYISLTLC